MTCYLSVFMRIHAAGNLHKEATRELGPRRVLAGGGVKIVGGRLRSREREMEG